MSAHSDSFCNRFVCKRTILRCVHFPDFFKCDVLYTFNAQAEGKQQHCGGSNNYSKGSTNDKNYNSIDLGNNKSNMRPHTQQQQQRQQWQQQRREQEHHDNINNKSNNCNNTAATTIIAMAVITTRRTTATTKATTTAYTAATAIAATHL